MTDIKELIIMITPREKYNSYNYIVLFKNNIIFKECAGEASRWINIIAHATLENINIYNKIDPKDQKEIKRISKIPGSSREYYNAVIHNKITTDNVRFYTMSGEPIEPKMFDI